MRARYILTKNSVIYFNEKLKKKKKKIEVVEFEENNYYAFPKKKERILRKGKLPWVVLVLLVTRGSKVCHIMTGNVS